MTQTHHEDNAAASRLPAILVVDDNRTFQSMIAMVLKDTAPGHRVLHAHTVASAAEIAQSPDIDIFIIDVHLPDGTGLDLLGRIRSSHPKARAIMMTSSPEADHRDMAQEFGAVRFLAKPIHLKRFSELIRTLIENPSDGDVLSNVAALDVIDMQSLALSEALIVFQTKGGKEGWVALSSGRISGARAGRSAGLDAIRVMAGWSQVRFELRPFPEGFNAEINRPWREMKQEITRGSDGAAAFADPNREA